MDMFMDGLANALTPENLLYAVIGVLLGTMVGVLPGIGPAMTLALLFPITYTVPVDSAVATPTRGSTSKKSETG